MVLAIRLGRIDPLTLWKGVPVLHVLLHSFPIHSCSTYYRLLQVTLKSDGTRYLRIIVAMARSRARRYAKHNTVRSTRLLTMRLCLLTYAVIQLKLYAAEFTIVILWCYDLTSSVCRSLCGLLALANAARAGVTRNHSQHLEWTC
jgi:hypothetical protein